MSDNLEKPKKQVNRQAEEALKQYVQNYAGAILHHAKVIAYRSNSVQVQSSHVEEAIEIINRSKKQLWSKDMLLTVGGAFFGTFVQGFVTEFSTKDVNASAVVIYVILGFLGSFLVFWGTLR